MTPDKAHGSRRLRAQACVAIVVTSSARLYGASVRGTGACRWTANVRGSTDADLGRRARLQIRSGAPAARDDRRVRSAGISRDAPWLIWPADTGVFALTAGAHRRTHLRCA